MTIISFSGLAEGSDKHACNFPNHDPSGWDSSIFDRRDGRIKKSRLSHHGLNDNHAGMPIPSGDEEDRSESAQGGLGGTSSASAGRSTIGNLEGSISIMNRLTWALLIGLSTSLSSSAVWAQGHGHGTHQTRTYFGPPGFGPYADPNAGGPGIRYQHPWTAKVFGIRCCQTPEEQQMRLAEKRQIIQARYEVEMARLNYWSQHNAKHLGQGVPNGLGPCNCGRQCAGKTGTSDPNCYQKHPGCTNCMSGHPTARFLNGVLNGPSQCGSGCCQHGGGCGQQGCNTCGGKGCSTCGGKGGGHGLGGLGHKLGTKGLNAYNDGYVPGGVPPYQHPGYPPMNREDATRYIEGFQYYPPNQLIRSPRDFYMFDTKYGFGH